MEIRDIETIPVEIPLKGVEDELGIAPYAVGGNLRDLPETLDFEEALDKVEDPPDSARKLVIRITTDEGIDGWGEIHVPSFKVGTSVYEEIIGPELIGRSVSDMESLIESFEWFPSGYYRDIKPYLGAVEIAMWDALGKQLDKPVHALIGGKRQDTIQVAWAVGLLTPDESRTEARKGYEQGFRVLKTKGSRYWEEDVERIKAMHDEVGGDMEFRLDPNQLWSFDQAVRVGAKLEDAGIYLEFLEQPIRIDNFGTLKRLRQRLRTPIAVNEDAYVPRNLSHIGSEAGIDAAVIDLIPAGGILGFKKLAGLCEEMGISVAHHSNLDLGIKAAAKLHVMSSTQGCNLAMDSAYYAYEDSILENPLEFENGRMHVPNQPGLAGPIDEDKLEQYRID